MLESFEIVFLVLLLSLAVFFVFIGITATVSGFLDE